MADSKVADSKVADSKVADSKVVRKSRRFLRFLVLHAVRAG